MPDISNDEAEGPSDGEGMNEEDLPGDDAVLDDAPDAEEESETVEARAPILADYNSELRETEPRSDGHRHVDSPLLVERLVALNANTYAFLIYHDTKDWEDLQEYLPLAEAAGLKTWVYLVPPSELPPQYPPYEADYVAWGRAIGQLAGSYPGLTAFAMDDFNGNLSTFTTGTTCGMLQAARESRPDIRFYAVDYFSTVIRDFKTRDFRGCIDGIIFPYVNLDSNAAMRGQIEQIASLRATGPAMNFSYPADTSSAPGDYVRYSLACTAEAPNGRVTFLYADDYDGPTTGYHVARIRFGDATLWSEDTGGTEEFVLQSVDFTTSSGTPLIVEVYDEQGVGNYGINVEFSAIDVEGCGASEAGDWTMTSNNTHFSAGINDTLAYPGLEIIPMIYATSTSWHSQPPTTEIIREAVSVALGTWEDGISQGAITYCLTKDPPTDPDYLAVQAIYAAYAE